ncbi:hypothetical protein [Pelagibaculum spongiae]|uniref:Glycosyltransferase family 1 protein n=1 Tax=Pelagibaculum spongiae TaxID=2080658 RepID=A0A2V1H1C8_9GAMM|nr:hypothetical protein [Pelagibaculum spongiae]PVZ70232.1 hypothetical protein DC094_06425 [Pelagibaculum spongiae]
MQKFSEVDHLEQVISSKVIVISHGCQATVDRYFTSRIATENLLWIDTSTVNWQSSLNRLKEFQLQGACCLFVRKLPRAVLQYFLKLGIRKAIWFLDDDIPTMMQDISLPLPYRLKHTIWLYSNQRLLEKICNRLLVSTSHLANKYLTGNIFLPPALAEKNELALVRSVPDSVAGYDISGTSALQHSQEACIFYHGSASHKIDHQFMAKVFPILLDKQPTVKIQVIADKRIRKLYPLLPQIDFVQPMVWHAYLDFIKSESLDIGLAPQMDSLFNRSRSHNKLIDFCLSQAIGVFSPGFSFADDIKRAEAGVVCENQPLLWAKAIEEILQSEDFENRKQQTVFNAIHLCKELQQCPK